MKFTWFNRPYLPDDFREKNRADASGRERPALMAKAIAAAS